MSNNLTELILNKIFFFAHTNAKQNGGNIMITIIALLLTIVGALNWLAVGIFDFNLVSYLFSGNLSFIADIVYIIVGVAGAWLIYYLVKSWNTLSRKV